jgi:hypothetical protein
MRVISFRASDLVSGRHLGWALLCPEARYASIWWNGAPRADRCHAPVNECPDRERRPPDEAARLAQNQRNGDASELEGPLSRDYQACDTKPRTPRRCASPTTYSVGADSGVLSCDSI